VLLSSEISYFNADYVSKNKSLIDGYLEVYEGLCDVKKVNLFFFHLIFVFFSIMGVGKYMLIVWIFRLVFLVKS
jgi:hypothetical protein